jgi:hypothetical protein
MGGVTHEDAVWDACDMAMDRASARRLADRIKQERAEKYEPTSEWAIRALTVGPPLISPARPG